MELIRENRIVRICLLVIAFMVAAGMMSFAGNEAYAASVPAQVKNVKLAGSTATSLKVSWGKASNAKKYQVAYKKVGAANFKTVTVTNRTRNITALSNDTTYAVKVRAVNGKKYGKWSAVKKFKTKVNYTKAVNEAKVKVTVNANKITIKINSLGLSGKATLYSTNANTYLKADPNDGIVSKNVTGTKIGTFSMNKAKTFTINRMKNGYDRLYDKYYIVYDGVIIKGPVYATTIKSKSTKAVEIPTATKKGLVNETSESTFDIMQDLGCKWTAINIDFTQLVLAEAAPNAETVKVNGKTIYINGDYVRDLDARLSRYEDMGVNVVGILISFVSQEATSNYPSQLKYIKDARWTNGFNTSTAAGRDYFIGAMEFLADRYSQGGNGRICNYIIGNEVDYAYDWNEIIPNKSKNGKALPPRGEKSMRKGEVETRADFDTYMEEYSRALRLANLAVKKYSSDVTVGISLSKEWSKSKGEQKKVGTGSKWYDTYSPKKMLDWLNYYSKKGGDYDWTITPHNYPVVEGNAAAYETGLTSKQVVISGNPDNSTMITQNNLEVMQLYLNRNVNKYNGKVREMYLTENGVPSHSEDRAATDEEQKIQAAAIAQYYYRAASLPSVKAIIYYKIKDRAQEGATSYKLGLIDVNGNQKMSYELWKYIDTNLSFEYSNQYLNKIKFKKNGKVYSKANGNIKSYKDAMTVVKSNFNWNNNWNVKKMTPITVTAPAAAVQETEAAPVQAAPAAEAAAPAPAAESEAPAVETEAAVEDTVTETTETVVAE